MLSGQKLANACRLSQAQRYSMGLSSRALAGKKRELNMGVGAVDMIAHWFGAVGLQTVPDDEQSLSHRLSIPKTRTRESAR